MSCNSLYVKKISLKRNEIENFDIYPFNVEIVSNFEELHFISPVSFFVGENGIGKSTFIEAIAVACGLNPEGGTQNFNFDTKDTHSNLHEYLTIAKFDTPKMKYFLRAESFYNVSSEIQRLNEEDGYYGIYDYYGGNLHECSHGEAFIKLIQNRFSDRGLYILDEPEAALSPSRQLTLLKLIDDLVKQGSQFIIATHSPILMSYRDGIIYDLNNEFEKISYEDTENYKLYKIYLERYEQIQEHLFKEDEI